MFTLSSDNEPSKEELILEAAMKVFIEKGWSGARMQEIADRAGINKTLLHYYFRSKENLYRRILQQVLTFFFRQASINYDEADDFESFLRKAIAAIIDTANDNPQLPIFIMQELSRGGATVREVLRDVVDREEMVLPELLMSRVSQALATGTIRRIDPIQFLLTLIGGCIYFFVAEPIAMEIIKKQDSVGAFDRAAFIEERKEEIFNVLYYGIKA
ncbi:TetR/AcrR family transcriptional regulator [Sediminispirochaeta smaragdinae]|uniref:Transcriptional regulator, TetR family n=1 Tax=Sediminispirochaeta smaragdinae (strain DSM 11293 / JCM 15392 / SEBR 4228) TaxID=573413 RepID=E1R2H0_SEDSS|nr:TetR/AcrR family transcriptional regulator [Sediminispirochaeta smaragdinae]ADK82530.1 transcriptional regulator, TetR family [Sediminispirochaeta smaragdinae DSM 11293]